MFGRRGVNEDGLNPRPHSPEIRSNRPEPPRPPAPASQAAPEPAPEPAPDELRPSSNVIPVAAAIARTVPLRSNVNDAAPRIYPLVLQRIDTEVAAKLQRDELSRQLADMVSEIVVEQRIQFNQSEQRQLVIVLFDDMLGLGPLEPLLADETITDIMVNGPKQVYVERRGKLELTDVTFRDNAHVMSIAHAHRHPGRPAHRRIDAPGRRAPAGRQPRQHHRPAAGHRRPDHLDPQILQEGHHAGHDGAVQEHLGRDGDAC